MVTFLICCNIIAPCFNFAERNSILLCHNFFNLSFFLNKSRFVGISLKSVHLERLRVAKEGEHTRPSQFPGREKGWERSRCGAESVRKRGNNCPPCGLIIDNKRAPARIFAACTIAAVEGQ